MYIYNLSLHAYILLEWDMGLHFNKLQSTLPKAILCNTKTSSIEIESAVLKKKFKDRRADTWTH